MAKFFIAPLLAWMGRLKHPTLFKLVLGLFALSVLLPDPLPLVDEMLLAGASLWLARWKRQRAPTDTVAIARDVVIHPKP